MAFTTLPSILWLGFTSQVPQSSAIFATDMNGSTRQRVAFVTPVPRTGTLDRIIFGSPTQTSMQDVKVSFQGLSSGLPNNSITHFRVVTAGTFGANSTIRTGLITDDGTDTGAKKSVTKNDMIVIVIEWNGSAGTSCSFMNPFGNAGPEDGMTYQCNYNGTSWSKFTGTAGARIAFEYSDGVIETYGYNYAAGDTESLAYAANNATQDECGLRFTMPSWSGKLSLVGAWGMGNVQVICTIYDLANNVVASKQLGFLEQNLSTMPVWFGFDDVELEAGTTYRITFKSPDNTNTSIHYWHMTTETLSQVVGNGTWYWTERVDSGSWTDRTSRLPQVMLGFSAIEP